MTIFAAISLNDILLIVCGTAFVLSLVGDQIGMLMVTGKEDEILQRSETQNSIIGRLWAYACLLAISNPLRYRPGLSKARSTAPGPVLYFVFLLVKLPFLGKDKLFSSTKLAVLSRNPGSGTLAKVQTVSNGRSAFKSNFETIISDDSEGAPLDPPPTQAEVHEAEMNPWPGHTMRETILRNRGALPPK